MTAAVDPHDLGLLDALPCAVLQTAVDGTILRANRTCCDWFGYEREELVGKRRFADLLTIGARIFHQTHWVPLLQMQGSISEVKLDVLRRDGATVPIMVNAVRRRPVGGPVVDEIAAFVARDRDKYERYLVASRKGLEELVGELTRLQADANDRAVAAEQMIGLVSHDLRNPLSAIAVGTALLAGADPAPGQQRALDRIGRAVARATSLTADLLDFTQARLGKGLSLSAESIDLHETIAQVVDDLGAVHPARSLHHVRSGEGRCSGDANRLGQLVGNLVSNAVAYSDPRSTITVASSVEESRYTISVHNLGEPIDREAQARIFQPMERGTKSNAGRSVGLGLFIVREIAKAHGGTVSVTSTASEGTTFSATMPRG